MKRTVFAFLILASILLTAACGQAGDNPVGSEQTTEAVVETISAETASLPETEAATEAVTEAPAHVHAFGEVWESDGESHWKVCDCGEIGEKAAHAFGDWTVTKEATEEEEGSRERVCAVCGRKESEPIPKVDKLARYKDLLNDADFLKLNGSRQGIGSPEMDFCSVFTPPSEYFLMGTDDETFRLPGEYLK